MWHPKEYRDQRVVVLGMAKSGTAVAKLFHSYGAQVVVNDRQERSLCPEADELERLGMEVICGQHPHDLLTREVALVVKNPGIPYHVPVLQQAQSLGLEIVTEVEVAAQICATRNIIGITGSNGKTTTTSWIGEVLRKAGRSTIVAGNIGRALCDAVPDLSAEDWLVLELSSFQLMGVQTFAPRIAVLLNFAETHLDYHGTMADYVAAKAKLFAAQTGEDVIVINADDPLAMAAVQDGRVTASLAPFSASETLTCGVFVRDGWIIDNLDADEELPIIEVSKLGIPGKHNVENALAVVAATRAAGVGVEVLREVLQSFRGVEHRLEWVLEEQGIRVYNDSKATNPQATIKAIDGFPGDIILLAGGLDRGSDYKELTEVFGDKCKGLIAFGETREKLATVARTAGVERIAVLEQRGSDELEAMMSEAVETAFHWAETGDVVLLSPACASWDMFTSYEVRGRMFKNAVHKLLKRH